MIHTLEQKPSRNHREARRKKYEDATETTNRTYSRVELLTSLSIMDKKKSIKRINRYDDAKQQQYRIRKKYVKK